MDLFWTFGHHPHLPPPTSKHTFFVLKSPNSFRFVIKKKHVLNQLVFKGDWFRQSFLPDVNTTISTETSCLNKSLVL